MSTVRSGASRAASVDGGGKGVGRGAGGPSGRKPSGATTGLGPAKSTSGRLTVSPPSVEFHGIAAGSVYAINLRILNSSKQSTRVRIQPPKSSRFRVNFDKGAAVAPGLEVIAEVEFVCDEALVRTTIPILRYEPCQCLTLCAACENRRRMIASW